MINLIREFNKISYELTLSFQSNNIDDLYNYFENFILLTHKINKYIHAPLNSSSDLIIIEYFKVKYANIYYNLKEFKNKNINAYYSLSSFLKNFDYLFEDFLSQNFDYLNLNYSPKEMHILFGQKESDYCGWY